MVLYGSGIFQFRLFGYANELLDVVPLAAKESGIVRYGVICGVHGGYARDDGELAASVSLGKSVLQIEPRRVAVKQVDNLNVGAGEIGLRQLAYSILGILPFASAGAKRQ